MVEISASMVKDLRERSGAAMMDCKRALVEAAGDFEKAFEVLRQRGIAVASKKATRTVAEGLVSGKVSSDGKSGVIIEVACETDFVARNPEFIALCEEIRDAAFDKHPSSLAALLEVKIGNTTVENYLTEKIAKTGENIVIRRMALMELGSKPGAIGLYIHALGGKMGAIVEIESTKEVSVSELSTLAREIAMHIVSAKPQFIDRSEVPKEVLENEQRIEAGKADLADKKPEIRDKIVTGRVDKLIAERCLLEQPFVKDPSQTIAQYIKGKGSALGAELKLNRFALFILGEAISTTENNGAGSSNHA